MTFPGGNPAFPWIWSEEYRDWYFISTDEFGNTTYQWSRQQQQAVAGASVADPAQHSRQDSTNTPVSADPQIRLQHPNLIQGTPEKGWYESLDSSYRMRSGAEAYSFFKFGKVFSMLHIQAASANTLASDNDNVTVVKYGEQAYSQIRRFVIMEVRHGFVYACPITTYSRRATLKGGCNPREHSAVYLQGRQAILLNGEILEKDPICIIPAEPNIKMEKESRLHYAKPWPVEMNVKVKDIGDVDPKDLSNLLRYYQEENRLRV